MMTLPAAAAVPAAAATAVTPAPAAAATGAAAATTTGSILATGPPPPDLSAKTVGEVLAHWAEELAAQAGAFREQAEQVATWDAVLRRHLAALGRLAEDVRELKVGQKGLDGTLDAIEAHQRMMEGTLEVRAREGGVGERERAGWEELRDGLQQLSFPLAPSIARP